MQRSFRSLFWGVGLLALLPSTPVQAATQDAAAQELADQAIFTDYLQLDFKSGEKKLKKAIQLCEKGTCSANVAAQVHRDLAVIYITGMKRSEDGRQLLVKALHLDPNIALDADLTTPELIRVFAAAKEDVAQEESDRKAAVGAAAVGGAAVAAGAASGDADVELTGEGTAGESAAPDQSPAKGSMDDPSPGSIDCPPDFPGCKAVGEDTGAVAEPEEAAREIGVRNWLSAALQQDFLMFSAASGVCGPEQPDELSCYRAGDVYRPGTADNTAGDGGTITGGFRLGTTRLMLGYDRVLLPNISAGVRVGYALGGGPTEPEGAAFVPIHAELRGTYWFGPIEPGKLRAFATLSGGLAQVDSKVTTQVVDVCSPEAAAAVGCTVGQIPVDANGNPAPSTVTVWKKTGTTFAAIGGGALYPLDEHSGISAELKAVLLFPSSGVSVALQAGYTYGF